MRKSDRLLDVLRKAITIGRLKVFRLGWLGVGRSYEDVDPKTTLVRREDLYLFFEGINQRPKFLFDPDPPESKEVVELKRRITELEARNAELEAAQKDRPLLTTERRTLLTLLWVVADMPKLDLSHLRAAGETIALATQKMGVSIGSTTIYEKLREAKDFIPPAPTPSV